MASGKGYHLGQDVTGSASIISTSKYGGCKAGPLSLVGSTGETLDSVPLTEEGGSWHGPLRMKSRPGSMHSPAKILILATCHWFPGFPNHSPLTPPPLSLALVTSLPPFTWGLGLVFLALFIALNPSCYISSSFPLPEIRNARFIRTIKSPEPHL